MKKILIALLSGILMLTLAGCPGREAQPERKPDTAPPPKAGDINFSIIDPAGAPGKIGDLVNRLKTSESASLAEEDGDTYVLVTRGQQRTGGYDVKLEKVTQAVGAGNKTTATIRVLYTDPKPGQGLIQSITYPLILAKLDIGKKPDEITFIIQREEPAARAPEAKKPSQPKEDKEKKIANIIVDQPKSGATVTSPFIVSGRARAFEANVLVRLLDDKGNTITRKFVTATAAAPEWGNFNTSVQYTAPPAPQKATLQVYTESADTGEEKDLVSIPLTIK